MSSCRVGRAWPVLSVAVVLCLFGFSGTALAQEDDIYVGAYLCSSCHQEEYEAWSGHGHAWMMVYTGGEEPPEDLFEPVGVPLHVDEITDVIQGVFPNEPDPWTRVQYILGHFKDGHGYVLFDDGRRLSVEGGNPSTMPGRCTKCHVSIGLPGKFPPPVVPDLGREPLGFLPDVYLRQSVVTDGVVTTGSTTITSATAHFTADMAGRFVWVEGGTGGITGAFYTIVSSPSSTTIIVDKSTGLKTGTGVKLQLGLTKIQGTWPLDPARMDNIQCEHCHGAGPTMEVPLPDTDFTNFEDRYEDSAPQTKVNLCRDCHSTGDFGTKMGSDPYAVGFRIRVGVPAGEDDQFFTGHHGEGDEYRRSPHKNNGCQSCHDPHKSVWKNAGGIRYANPESETSIGLMCTHCHTQKVRGIMGEFLVCLDCHMPENSAEGHRRTHIWKINTDPITEEENVKMEPNDSGTSTAFWMNYDGTTGAGDTFITLDTVCAGCHEDWSIDLLSRMAETIHRAPGFVDLTINGGDNIQAVSKTQQVSVDFSVYPDYAELEGEIADVYVLQQGAKGWMYWTGKSWKSGIKPWKTNMELTEMTQNAFKGYLKPGSYSYWVQIYAYPSDAGTEEFVDSVVLNVSKK